MKKAIAICVGSFAFAFAGTAHGQATRTWVSGVGDDVNPCSRTAPCKTFAGAISKTAAGGEINCLDPGGYGAVTITKSMTIDCSEEFGSILNSAVNGININDSATGAPNTIEVVIRGVHINGSGTTLGLNGIRFTSGRSLVVENVTIEDQSTAGISMQPGGVARLHVLNTTIENIGTDAAGRGILIQPTGAGGNARVLIANSRVLDTAFEGIRVDAAGNTNVNPILVTLHNSQVSGAGAGTGIIVASSPGLSFARMAISNSHISNTTSALTAFGTPATILVGSSVITANTNVTNSVSGGIIQSYGNNQTQGNTNAASFTPPTLTQN
jgi:hypothetical protein